MIEELFRSLHCIHIASGRNKHQQIDEFVHNHHHRVMILFGHGQGGNKVHTHLQESVGICSNFSRPKGL
jgi:hypothetical protein